MTEIEEVREMLSWAYRYVDPYKHVAWDIKKYLESHGVEATNPYLESEEASK